MARSAKTTAGPRTRPARTGARIPHLVALHDPVSGIQLTPPRRLGPGRHLVGREVDDVVLTDPRASRHHATLHVASRSNRLRVTDEGSRNGTAVNGRLVDEAWLEDGDILRFADSHFAVRALRDDEGDGEVTSLVGRAPEVRRLRAMIPSLAAEDVTVLLTGESGTGKEVVARAIHEASGRKGPFIAVNCAAIPEHLAESQLFGHRSGAFTGADRDHDGFFRAAQGGTLFLDEVGDLPAPLQPKLLRALEERTVTPVGATKAIPFDARVLAATNVNLESAIEGGDFRGDLYARLAEIEVPLPPLRARREDILVLLERLGGDLPELDADLVAALLQHDYRYNVRELRAIARELQLRGAGRARWELELVAHRLRDTASNLDGPEGEDEDDDRSAPPSRDELEAILREARGNVRAISRRTGRSRMQVYRWVEQHGLNLADYRGKG
ncbi:MAG: sigma 54-interacting transcriptional regulator [Polyangiaceae bacterium]